MMDLSLIARLLALFGLVLLFVAGLLYILDRAGVPLGDLPGDLKFQRGNLTCVVPIVSSLIISIVLTVVINLIIYFLNK